MARGTVVGEQVVSQAQSRAFDEGAERIGLGKSDRAKERGRFVWDEKRQKLVRPWEVEMDETKEARFAPISTDRHYEGVASPIDGTVFQSRRQYQAYCKAKGLANASDYDKPGGAWDKAEAKRAQRFATPEQQRDRQERIGRRLYEIEKMSQSKYDRECREIEQRRRARGPGTPTE